MNSTFPIIYSVAFPFHEICRARLAALHVLVEQELERAELGFQLLDLRAFCCKKTLCLTYTSARAGHAQGSLVRLPLLLAVELPLDTKHEHVWLESLRNLPVP
jgi:hypothetical protein